ncbi:VOC family protein, partial [Methylopila musalis]
MAVPSAAPQAAARTLPAGFALGVAELAVSDLPRSVAFYERIVGLRRLSQEPGVAELGGD